MGSTQTTEVSCILCDVKDFDVLKKITVDTAILNLVKCKKCSLVFLSPRITNVSDVYSSDSLNNSTYYSEVLDDDKNSFRERLKFCEKYLTSKTTVLDIGASVGTFLSVCRKAGFKKIHGVELNKSSREKAKSLFSIDLGSSIPDNVKADLTNMSDLIEHLVNPLTYLNSLKKSMADNSILMITTPDMDRWITPIVNIKPKEHLFYFTKKTLRILLERAGFEILYLGNTTRFRKFRHLVGSTNAKNPLIRIGLSTLVALHLDGIGEKLLFHNLNNDILCICLKKVRNP